MQSKHSKNENLLTDVILRQNENAVVTTTSEEVFRVRRLRAKGSRRKCNACVRGWRHLQRGLDGRGPIREEGTEESGELCQGRRGGVGPVPPSPVNRKTTPTASNVMSIHHTHSTGAAYALGTDRFLNVTDTYGNPFLNIWIKHLTHHRLYGSLAVSKRFTRFEAVCLPSSIFLDVANLKHYLRPSIKPLLEYF